MSPEQARGQAVDKRTDIWAFGCVLYEMLTGRVAFAGETVSDTIGKILEREPDWSALPAATPAAIRRLLLRCLAKDPKQRLRDIGDVRIEIDAIDEVLPGVSDVTMAPPAPAKTRTTWLPWVALVALAASVGVWEARRPVTDAGESARQRPVHALHGLGGHGRGRRNLAGREVRGLPRRPRGRVRHLAEPGGHRTVFTISRETSRRWQPAGSSLRKLGFSGDGAEIWFNPAGRDKPLDAHAPDGRHATGVPGRGRQQPRLVSRRHPPRLLLQTRIAMIRCLSPIAPAQTRAKSSRLRGTATTTIRSGRQTASGSTSSRGSEPQDETNMDVWRVRPSGGSPERLTTQHAAVNFLAPLDTRTLLYVARAEDRSGPWLWALDVERKVTRRVTSGVDQYTSVSASRDGRRVVATVANPSASLWRVPLLDRSADDRDAQPYPLPVPTAGAGPALRRDVVVLSVRPRDGRRTVAGPGRTGVRSLEGARTARCPSRPRCRRTDSRVAVVVRQEGKRHLSIMSADGTNAQNVGPVHRNRRGGRPGHCGLVAGRRMDRDGRPRRAGSGVVQDPRG